MPKINIQRYPRNDNSLVKEELLSKQDPPLPLSIIDDAIKAAFVRSGKNKSGGKLHVPKTPEELVDVCLKHLKERSDPILSPFFFSQMKVEDVFDMDAIAHEMQRQRMKIGVFYQYLLIELMKHATHIDNSNIIQAFDGTREGDAVADIRTPSFERGLRLYISIKKSVDTVGGQDIGGVIRRLESIAKTEKNLTSPYLCVIAIATPARGKITSYKSGRSIRQTQEGHPYSLNCEFWMPGFIFPYITGRTPTSIYKESIKLVKDYLPFYTLKVRHEAAELLKENFVKLNISDEDGNIDADEFFNYIVN